MADKLFEKLGILSLLRRKKNQIDKAKKRAAIMNLNNSTLTMGTSQQSSHPDQKGIFDSVDSAYEPGLCSRQTNYINQRDSVMDNQTLADVQSLYDNFLGVDWPYDNMDLIDSHGGRPSFHGTVCPNLPIKYQLFEKTEKASGLDGLD